MLEKTLNSLWELKEVLSKDKRFQRLEMLEKEIDQDKTVKDASRVMKEMERKYEDAISAFGEHSFQANESQKELYKAKLKLDSLPLVSEYNKAYIEIKDLEMKLDDLLFSSFKEKGKC